MKNGNRLVLVLGGCVAACASSTFAESAGDVGSPRAPIASAAPLTPVFEPGFDPYGSTEGAAVAVYTCPMHPEIVRHEPGNCPICGMKLVLKAPKSRGSH
ncbi:MAG: heavy metal-binding domain-containing protein [Polyangiaceae bacterium]